jgi:hypothetical protein
MTKLIAYVACAAIVIGSAVAWYASEQHAAEERGAAIERAKVAAQSNQNIAERRKTDADFDKMDARALCIDAGLEWVFEDGKSFCR